MKARMSSKEARQSSFIRIQAMTSTSAGSEALEAQISASRHWFFLAW